MTKEEFNKEYWFHGKAPEHPTYGKDIVTGGATKSFKEAKGYAGKAGEVHLMVLLVHPLHI